MKVGDKLFVYGTLRPGHGANNFLNGRASHVGEDRIHGRMYNMGWFPGVRLDEQESIIIGDVYEIEDEGLPAVLDTYEGYPNLYGRKLVKTEGGEDVWVYEINVVSASRPVIESGDWNNRDG